MPTGYTSAIADGTVTSLKAYALRAARAMGALVTIRDEPWDAPIPLHLEPNTAYHDKALASAQSLLDTIMETSPEDHESAARKAFDDALAAYNQRHEERSAERLRYEAMRTKVAEWKGAPEGLQFFMLDQLAKSISADCNGSYDQPPKLLTGEAWRDATEAKARKDLAYHTTARAEEVERTEACNAWLAQLHASLAGFE